jgi:hypothetical protein
MRCFVSGVAFFVLFVWFVEPAAHGQVPAPPAAGQQQAATPPAGDDKQAKLRDAEIDKLIAEKEKLVAEKVKMETDVNAWVPAAISALSVLAVVVGLLFQYFQATRLQQRQARVDGELKMMEILMASRSPAMAQDRANLFLRMYRHEMSEPFAETIADIRKNFPGDIGMEVREKFLEVAGAQYQNPHDILALARRIFKNDEWLKEDLTPPKTP